MTDRWRWRALRLAHRPDEVWLVTAETAAELAAAARGAKSDGGRPAHLPRDQALALFDASFRQATFALRAFLRDNRLGPSVGLVREHQLVAHVRREIAAGAVVAMRPPAQDTGAPRPVPLLQVRAASSTAPPPVPIRRGPAPAPAPVSPESEGPEFLCPGPQAQALREAAATGVPFCAECERAAAARAAGGAR